MFGRSNLVETLECLVLGESDAELAFTSADENRELALALVRQARSTLQIFSRDLDPPVYDNVPFADALTAFCRRSRYAQAQILVQDTTALVRNGHRLVPLAQKLSSLVQIRRVCEECQDFGEAFLVADRTGLVHRRQGKVYRGVASFKARGQARTLLNLFADVWERSSPDPELRRLYI
jgi:hypothetical protein